MNNPSARSATAPRKPTRVGWLSTDEQEIEIRRLRAETEPMTNVAPAGCQLFDEVMATLG